MLSSLFSYHLPSEVMNEITHCRSGVGWDLRPVFIVFEDSNSLESFYNSEFFRKEKKNGLIITEKTSKDKRNLNVRLATTAGKIVLFTREFGGGPHII